MQIDENKKKALELAIKQIDKAFGKGALVRLGDKVVEPIASISTGSIGLDLALGIGGIPQGRIIEIMDQKVQVRRHYHFKLLQKHNPKVVSAHLSMLNMHLMSNMLEI